MNSIHATLINHELDRFFIRCDDTSKRSNFRGHVGHGCAFINAEFLHSRARILNNLPNRVSIAYVWVSQNLKHIVFRGNIWCRGSPYLNFEGRGYAHAHVLCEPRVENRCRSDTESE